MDAINKIRRYWGEEKPVKILLIEDNPDHVLLIRDMLIEAENAPFDLEQVDLLSKGLTRLAQGNIDVVLLDLLLPDSRGLKSFEEINNRSPEVPIIILTALDDETLALLAVQAGAQDYLIKGRFDSGLLGRSLCYAIKRQRLLEKIRQSERELKIRNRIAEIFLTIPEEEMYEEILKVILENLESEYGCFGYIDQRTGSLVFPSMIQNIFDQNLIPAYKKIFPKDDCLRIWGEISKEKKIIYSNNPRSVSEGHAPITRFMAVPIIYCDELIGIIQVANKTLDYDEKDCALLETISAHIAPVLQARLESDRQNQERQQAQKELKESNGKYQKLIETANDAIFIADAETGEIIEVNKKAEKLIGLPAKEIIGMHQTQLHPQQEVERYANIFREDVQKGKNVTLNTFVVHRDGYQIPIEISASVTTVGNRKIIQGIFRDLTEAKRAEEELKFRNIILSTQQETSLDGILVVDKDGKMSSFNQRFVDMWGIPPDIMESRSDERALKWVCNNKLADPEQFIARVNYLYDHQNEKSQDVFALVDGRILERYSAPMLEPTGKNYGRVWYFRDITERKRAEEELTQYRQHLEELVEERTAKLTEVNENLKQEISERSHAEEELRKFKFISDNSNDAHFLMGRDAKFKYVNKIACEMTGYSESELLTLGVPDMDIVYNLPRYQELFDRIQKETIPPIETINKRKDGTTFPSEITVTGYQIDGTPYIFAALRDISERKQAEEVLRARQQEIKQLNANLEKRVHNEVKKSREKDRIMVHQARLAAMGEMIGLIAHQWKQPLNALNLLLYNIEDFCEENQLNSDSLDSFFEKGRNLITKMSTTIDDFRNFFKPTKEKEKFCINKIIKDSFFIVDTSFKHNNISVSINEKEQLDAIGFPNEYSQVIVNILNNAKDAIVSKGEKGEITIDILQQNNSAVVKIKDNGGGIPEDALLFIFEPYFTTRQEAKGAGMGLYISKVIVEDHMAGHVDVQNIGDGAEFSITTPLPSPQNHSAAIA